MEKLSGFLVNGSNSREFSSRTKQWRAMTKWRRDDVNRERHGSARFGTDGLSRERRPGDLPDAAPAPEPQPLMLSKSKSKFLEYPKYI